ncbi:hypothetical protein SVOphi44_16 [Psuedomonas phage SVOphi44]
MLNIIERVLKFLVAILSWEASKHGKRSAAAAVNRAVSVERERIERQRITHREVQYRLAELTRGDIHERHADRASALASKINALIK